LNSRTVYFVSDKGTRSESLYINNSNIKISNYSFTNGIAHQRSGDFLHFDEAARISHALEMITFCIGNIADYVLRVIGSNLEALFKDHPGIDIEDYRSEPLL
jgi:hypothetical protein